MASLRFETVLQRPEGEATTTFIEIPADVRTIFGRARPPVTVTINGLSFSHRRETVGWIAEAKRAETRERRIAATVRRLSEDQSPGP